MRLTCTRLAIRSANRSLRLTCPSRRGWCSSTITRYSRPSSVRIPTGWPLSTHFRPQGAWASPRLPNWRKQLTSTTSPVIVRTSARSRTRRCCGVEADSWVVAVQPGSTGVLKMITGSFTSCCAAKKPPSDAHPADSAPANSTPPQTALRIISLPPMFDDPQVIIIGHRLALRVIGIGHQADGNRLRRILPKALLVIIVEIPLDGPPLPQPGRAAFDHDDLRGGRERAAQDRPDGQRCGPHVIDVALLPGQSRRFKVHVDTRRGVRALLLR